MYRKIGDYGVVGNLHTVALVGLDGSIDWMCLPHIDSPSVFGALLDDALGGRFSLSPAEGQWDSVADYAPGTNILITRFRTPTGELELTDFMPVTPPPQEAEPCELFRLFKVTSGSMRLRMLFKPAFDYARAPASLGSSPGGLTAEGGGTRIHLASTHAMRITQGAAEGEWELGEGQEGRLRLYFGTREPAALDPGKGESALEGTRRFWLDWVAKSETGRTVNAGPYKEMLERSALLLKLLYFDPTGAIAAAPTTSLPEEIGGERNWDYRYTWVRDTAFTLQALFSLGHLEETQGYLRWIQRLISQHGVHRMQIMYGLRGEEDLKETELLHLDGYRGSRPVRIGNAAAAQRQLDIYGELMDAALKLSDYVGRVDYELWPFLRSICDHAATHWREPDSGIWEVRGGPRHYVYSKVMCWVALDRGLTISRRYGFPADAALWERTRKEIKQEVLQNGWSAGRQAFLQHYGSEALDASNLLIPRLGFLPFDDPRVLANIEATMAELAEEGLLYRYTAPDGLRGGEGTFLICTFWLIDSLVATGRLQEAETLLKKMEGLANHLGLFPEQYDTRWREPLGNFPQALTHIGYVNSVMALLEAKERRRATMAQDTAPAVRLPLMPFKKVTLNGGAPEGESLPPSEVAVELKNRMNVLRGAFFDTARGRVAYERMRRSEAYASYERLSRSLRAMDPLRLMDRSERLAFWINLYNVLVIDGVIALGIRDSVKEVGGFFRRVRYLIGGTPFSPDDIEHGILRGNRKRPGAVLRQFGRTDLRRQLAITPLEPRIHFALVCASSSCPPIGVYTAEGLDSELDIAARTFVNAGGLVIDSAGGAVSLSQVFKWYARDFGPDDAAVLRFLAPYVIDQADSAFLAENAHRLRVSYQSYDWRLNRY